jgi:hypothetical protein
VCVFVRIINVLALRSRMRTLHCNVCIRATLYSRAVHPMRFVMQV